MIIDVSVVIAVKNEEVFLQSAVTSVLEQTGLCHEVIVIDDGSTDKTADILAQLRTRYPQLTSQKNPRAGKCSAFNHGVSLASGRFVCIFAGDDLMPPGSLAERYARVKDLPDNQAVVGLCKLITMSEEKRFDGHLVPRKPGRGALSGVSPLMNQRALHRIFPVPGSLPNEDTWMEIAVLHFHDMVVVHSDVVGCAWRVHQGNSINMMADFAEYNRKISIRLRAYALFLAQHREALSEESRAELQARVDCEEQRLRGSVWGVLSSRVGLVDRLRALSITNAGLYGIRRRLYGLLSGW